MSRILPFRLLGAARADHVTFARAYNYARAYPIILSIQVQVDVWTAVLENKAYSFEFAR